MKTAKQVRDQYNRDFSISMLIYGVLLFAVIYTIKLNPNITNTVKYLLSILPSLPIGASIFIFLRYLRDSDEYLRAKLSRIFIVTTGVIMFLSTFWGFLELLAGAPHIELYWIYVIFWVVYGLISALSSYFFKDQFNDGLCL